MNYKKEVVYVEGHLYKMYDNDLEKFVNLKDGTISEYILGEQGLESVKTFKSSEGQVSKHYDTSLLFEEVAVEGVQVIVQSTLSDYIEKYFWLESPADLISLSNHYSLPMPINSAMFADFSVNTTDYNSHVSHADCVNPLMASVKFDLDGNATMLKMYKGSHSPEDDEIQASKAYWNNVGS